MVLTTNFINDLKSNMKTRIDTDITHAAVGDDDTAPTAADTVLGNETFRDAIDDVDTSAANTVTASLRILTTENNGNDVKEFGTFDDASAGTMWTRNTMTTIAKTSDIQLFLDAQVTINMVEGT